MLIFTELTLIKALPLITKAINCLLIFIIARYLILISRVSSNLKVSVVKQMEQMTSHLLEQQWAEKCLLEFSASGPIWADDVQSL